MQTLDIDRPDMPDLQFVLLVTALCTSRLSQFNVPEALRATIFDRCWTLIDDGPPPTMLEERVLDLRPWTEVTLEAMAETIRRVLDGGGHPNVDLGSSAQRADTVQHASKPNP